MYRRNVFPTATNRTTSPLTGVPEKVPTNPVPPTALNETACPVTQTAWYPLAASADIRTIGPMGAPEAEFMVTKRNSEYWLFANDCPVYAADADENVVGSTTWPLTRVIEPPPACAKTVQLPLSAPVPAKSSLGHDCDGLILADGLNEADGLNDAEGLIEADGLFDADGLNEADGLVLADGDGPDTSISISAGVLASMVSSSINEN